MFNKVFIVAAKEWRDGWRNRWLLFITLLFALMALGLSWFGAVATGQLGTAPLPTLIASLASLAVLVIPLIALLLGYDAFIGEQEQGTLILILTYPLSQWQLVVGKFLGQWAILASATFLGFGSAAGLLALSDFSAQLVSAFAVFIGSAILLGAVFLALAHLISLSVSEKSHAAGLALFVWFFFTLIYDLGLLSLLVATSGWLDQGTLKVLLLANPTDIFRLINLTYLDAQGTGILASLGQLRLGYPLLIGILVLWVTTSLTLTTWRFNSKTL
jgi:Cu-processing system permease protein